jgi:hypothetical protein
LLDQTAESSPGLLCLSPGQTLLGGLHFEALMQGGRKVCCQALPHQRRRRRHRSRQTMTGCGQQQGTARSIRLPKGPPEIGGLRQSLGSGTDRGKPQGRRGIVLQALSQGAWIALLAPAVHFGTQLVQPLFCSLFPAASPGILLRLGP